MFEEVPALHGHSLDSTRGRRRARLWERWVARTEHRLKQGIEPNIQRMAETTCGTDLANSA